MDPVNHAQVSNAVINLRANIDMAAFPLQLNAPDPITPNAFILGVQIGNNTVPFTGTFNGNGFVIRNLTIIGDGNRIIPVRLPPIAVPQVDATDGLFGVVQRPAALALAAPDVAIRNLILESPSITGYATDVGGLVGRLERGTIFQCCVVGPGDITAGGNGPNQSLGGLVGRIAFIGGGTPLWSDPTVSQCFATCNVRGPTHVGGLVGIMNGALLPPGTPGAYVQNSYAAGHTVVGAGNPFDALAPSLGGLVGLNNLGAITSCYADTIAEVRGDPTVLVPPPVLGSLVGTWIWANAAIITNFSETVDCPTSVPTGIGAGTAPGYAANALVPPGLTTPLNYIAAGWGLGTIWAVPQPGQTPRLLWRPF